MFPLGSVLLPGAMLPLHVFEPRYRRLVQDCVAEASHEFGVALIERGFEVGGGDFRTMVANASTATSGGHCIQARESRGFSPSPCSV